MIEQTPLIITEWDYHEPTQIISKEEEILGAISLDVMQKRSPTKKGIACRLTCLFKTKEEQLLLKYVAEDSYVIDLDDKIDRNELSNMIRNSYAKCKEKYELRKFGTVLQNRSFPYLNEHTLDLDPILPLLK